MKKVVILMLSAMLLSGSAMAQNKPEMNGQRPPMGQNGRPAMPPGNPPMGNPPGGMPPGGFGGGPGSQQKDIKYAGAKTLW